MKRLFCILLAVFLSVSIFTACKKEEETPTQSFETEYDPYHGVDFASEKLEVVTNGVSGYEIVIPSNPSESEKYAAEELKSFINQVTTANLKIVKDGSVQLSSMKQYISIGKTRLLDYVKSQDRYTCDYDSLNFDGFVIKTVDNLLLFDSYNGRGILYSVYDFLEKFCGVKFIASDCTYVPTNANLAIHQLDIVEVPAFEYRSYLSPMISGDLAFGVRMRMVHDYAKNSAQYGYNILQDFYGNDAHNFTDLVPLSQYYDEHPEWYSADKTMVCLTSGIKDYAFNAEMEESVAKVVIETVKQQIREKPSARYFYVSQDDLATSCNCKTCMSSDEKNGGKSGTLAVFLNVVSDELGKWLATYAPEREVNLVSFAYTYTLEPPTKNEGGKILPYNDKVILRDNVYIRIAPIHQCYYHDWSDTSCEKNKKIRDIFAGWDVVADHFMIWDYGCNYTELLWAYPNYSSMKNNLLFYKDFGVVYVMTQGRHQDASLYEERLKIYLLSKLSWNPYRNVNTLIEEFNYYYFGAEIAPYIDEYIATSEMHYAMLDSTIETGFHTYTYNGWGFLETTFYSKYYLENLTKTLTAALDKVSTMELSKIEKDKLEIKILRVLVTVQRMVIRNYGAYYDLSTELDYVKDFVKNAERIGLTYITESSTGTLDKFKEEYGLI